VERQCLGYRKAYNIMQPRLRTSKKWTAFPQEFAGHIHEIFETHFQKKLSNEQIQIEGRIYSEEVLLRVGLAKPNQLAQFNIELSAQYSYADLNADERIHNCIDAAATLIEEYLSLHDREEHQLPQDWTAFNDDKLPVYYKHSSVNKALEDEADRLLGLSNDQLVKEDEGEDPSNLH
jgi:hypothetical protein